MVRGESPGGYHRSDGNVEGPAGQIRIGAGLLDQIADLHAHRDHLSLGAVEQAHLAGLIGAGEQAVQPVDLLFRRIGSSGRVFTVNSQHHGGVHGKHFPLLRLVLLFFRTACSQDQAEGQK